EALDGEVRLGAERGASAIVTVGDLEAGLGDPAEDRALLARQHPAVGPDRIAGALARLDDLAGAAKEVEGFNEASLLEAKIAEVLERRGNLGMDLAEGLGQNGDPLRVEGIGVVEPLFL